MNVLIIDDQPDVVAGIHSGINWDALSIRQVFCANDIKIKKLLDVAMSIEGMPRHATMAPFWFQVLACRDNDSD